MIFELSPDKTTTLKDIYNGKTYVIGYYDTMEVRTDKRGNPLSFRICKQGEYIIIHPSQYWISKVISRGRCFKQED